MSQPERQQPERQQPESDAEILARLDARAPKRTRPGDRTDFRFAFYGRVSTKELQDVESSISTQLSKARQLIQGRGEIVTEYVDLGFSRSKAWTQREATRKLLEDVRRGPSRGWDALVVGASDRGWYDDQWTNVKNIFDQYEVTVFIPEVGGAYDKDNAGHEITQFVNGWKSKMERDNIRRRVKDAQSDQVITEGRWQGGTPPYGYMLENRGLHPKPQFAANGVHLRALVSNPDTAPILQRIFREYLAGESLRSIATRLNAESVPTPSEVSTRYKPTVRKSIWRASTIIDILKNPRYTGYEHWGKSRRVEVPVNINNPAEGVDVVRKRVDDNMVHSRDMTHPQLVSVADFEKVQLELERRAAEGLEGRRRSTTNAKTTYILKGMVVCAVCGRRMEGWRRGPDSDDIRYRCVYRKDELRPHDHAKAITVREADLVEHLMVWVYKHFAPENIDATIAQLTDAANADDAVGRLRLRHVEEQLAGEQRGLANLISSLAEGIDPKLIKPAMDAKSAAIKKLEAELAELTTPKAGAVNVELLARRAAEEFARVGDAPSREAWQELFRLLGIEVHYDDTSASFSATCRLVDRETGGRSEAISAAWS